MAAECCRLSCHRRPMAIGLPAPSASPSSASLSLRPRAPARSAVAAAAAGPPMLPLNPRDPFLQKLRASMPAGLELPGRSGSDGMPPFFGMFSSPPLMTAPAQLEQRSASYGEHKSRKPPPDLPSFLLHQRVVYLGMPLVSAVTELMIAQLLYLQYMDPKEPIYLYINSTGTCSDDNEPVALEAEGFAVYDTMMSLTNEVYTLTVGCAIGHACLLLAAGKKGKRFMYPYAKAMLQQPKVPAFGEMKASDVAIRYKEAIHNRNTLVKLLAQHTGNTEETILSAMNNGPFYLDAVKAMEFGVIDKIIRGDDGDDDLMKEPLSPEEWDRRAGVRRWSGM